ncbi:site-specific integrase [Phyllobacterium endophyticum]|uniref:Recombinase XerC n=1 Tax=Phyllobacterium endophyticum TaxID=1149773 RepID=A0A2P7AZH2_9HYPH|nr:tyrosine-type recombinase/integrase [Phyllobacterium endophyticum]MBB3235797.1 integrase [Phyllobacterium endophyticum]PSH59602.1 recombinase XerC [Phyllobacterium endophyticum]TYR41743.1 tyrosine-type recombinase/integrase [Phyllobacterium endophyticum]
MRKHHPKNERIKRQYLIWLEEAKRLSSTSADQAAAAIAFFEVSTNYKDFAAFNIEQARRFKRLQNEAIKQDTGKPLAKATIHSRLMALKAFFHWLAGQPGYKSKISYSDSDYFNPSANDSRIATAKREKAAPDLGQIMHVIRNMKSVTLLEKRNRALIAFAVLTGARDDALASMSLRHVNLERRMVFQDARDVRTKNRKTFTTWFFPVGDVAEAIVGDWIATLKNECVYGSDDPLFPQTQVGLDANGHFAPLGLERKHWKNAAAIRRIFGQSFNEAGLPYFNPHSFRTTLARLGETLCKTPEEFKAWSQNLGHEHVLTTFRSYGEVSSHRQAEIIRKLGTSSNDVTHSIDPVAIAALETFLKSAKTQTNRI